MKAKAFAKINLNLHILPKSENEPFTPLYLINHQIDIFDELTFINQKNEIELFCKNNRDLPVSKENIIYQTAQLLKKTVNNPKLGVKILLQKNIPITAGLAGGSADAALTLQSLIKLWKLNLKPKQVFDLADSLGKDVPYFLKGNLCQLNKYGNHAKKIYLDFPIFYLLIIYPNYSQKPSTKWMFQHLDFSKLGKNVYKSKLLIDAIKLKNKDQILANLHNDFETIVSSQFPETQEIVSDLLKFKASKTLLAGSGLGIIGFFKTKIDSQKAYQNLKEKFPKLYLTKTR